MPSSQLNKPQPTRTRQYKVLVESYLPRLEADVMDHLSNGWECQGGLSICFNDSANGRVYHQAMTRTTPDPFL